MRVTVENASPPRAAGADLPHAKRADEDDRAVAVAVAEAVGGVAEAGEQVELQPLAVSKRAHGPSLVGCMEAVWWC